MSDITQHLRRLALRDESGVADGELLSAFAHRRDDAALAALVRRHGPMVWGVCRRLLRSHHDAEDAFQATLLVLVRKAAAIRDRQAVANWLYGVAYQTAVRVRAAAAKRQRREGQVTDMPEPMAREASLWDDLHALLDLELSRLPDKYRVLIVLCDLEGKTRKEVARQLGCPEGTVAGRLARARVLLAKRLARHGLAVSGGALAAALSHGAAAAGVPAAVVAKTIRTATSYAAGPAAGLVPAPVAALAQGVMTAMFLTKLKAITAGLVLAGLLVCGLLSAAPAGAPRPAPSRQPAGENKDRPAGRAVRPKPPDGLKVRATLPGHGTGVYGLAFSPDGKLLASGSDDSSIKIWDTATAKEIRTLTGHQGVVVSLAFSPDRKSLASASRKIGGDFAEKVPAAVILWDVATGEEKVKLKDNDGAFQGLAFSPDGTVLAACDGSEQVKLWDTRTGKPLGILKEERGLIRALAFTPDGKTLVLGTRPRRGENEAVRLWDWAEKKANGSFKMDGECADLRFTRDGKTLVALNEHGEVTFWDYENWRPRKTVKAGRAPGWAGRPHGLALSADEKLLALGYVTQKDGKYAGKVDVRDAASGALVTTRALDMVVKGVAFSPAGGMLAAGCLKDARRERAPNAIWLQGQEGVVRIWDLRVPGK